MPVAKDFLDGLQRGGAVGRRVPPAMGARRDKRFPSVWVAQLHAPRLGGLQGRLGAGRDQRALLLGQRGVDVQHERVGIDAQLGDDERHPVGHQAADEVHVAAKPIELGDNHRGLELAGVRQCGGQLGRRSSAS